MSSHTTIQLDELARHLSIETIPRSWSQHWNAYRVWKEAKRCGMVLCRCGDGAQDLFHLSPASIEVLESHWQIVMANAALRELLDFLHFLVYHLPEGIGENSNDWPMPTSLLSVPWRTLMLMVVTSGAPHAAENFARANVPATVVEATLAYIGEYVREIKRKRGEFGLESLSWLRNYVRADIFRLGRLTFRASRYDWPFCTFQDHDSGEVQTLHAQESVRLEGVARWQRMLSPGDDCIEVHIAGGSSLTPPTCGDAYRQAMDFFPRRYPQSRFAAFTCSSWLLDPALSQILPPTSNIVRFAQAFHRVPILGDERQAYDLVFGSPTADPITAPKSTRLQQAIANYVAAGGKMRSAAGIRLSADVASQEGFTCASDNSSSPVLL